MLKKKLDKIVCRPRAIAVEETTTIRSVTDDGSRSPKFVDCHIESAQADLRPIRFLARAGRVKMGTEKQTCFPITFPRNHEVDVGRFQLRHSPKPQ